MAKKLSYKHKYYTLKDYEEEIVCENRVVASTSAAAMEGDGGQSHQDSSLELDPEELNTSEAAVARIRPRHRGRQNHFRFTPRQIREMESFFKIWQNPNLAAREALARALKVPEAKLKVWFTKRRAKDRKEKRVLIETTPPTEDILMLWDTVEDVF